MKTIMSKSTRNSIIIMNILLIAVFIFPVWIIKLGAPQYPEGLEMKIMLRGIQGELDIINDLNHYIGMKNIVPTEFSEFKYMQYVLALIILIGIITLVRKSKIWFSIWTWLLVIGGTAGMVDFYKWEYDYGHILDPHAAIKVPGMVYQPPFWGTKQLLNFTATSYPGIGGIVLIGVGIVGLFIWIKIAFNISTLFHHTKVVHRIHHALLLIIGVSLFSCATPPVPLVYKKDMCDYCKMQLEDPHYGGEIITNKGKIYKFDAEECMINFLLKMPDNLIQSSKVLAADYNIQGQLLDAKKALYLSAGKMHSPMGLDIAAFSNKEEAKNAQGEFGGNIVAWDDAINYVKSSMLQRRE